MEFNETFLPEDQAEPNGEATAFHAFDFEAIDSRIHPEAAPNTEHHYRAAGRAFIAFYDQVLTFILHYENPRLAAWVVAMASGRALLTDGISQKELADRLGISKAAVNKAVKVLQSRLGNDIAGMEPMGGQRSRESCHKFAQVRTSQLESNYHENKN